MVVMGLLDFSFVYKSLLLTFLDGKYFPVSRFNVTFKKFASIRFFSLVIEGPSF